VNRREAGPEGLDALRHAKRDGRGNEADVQRTLLATADPSRFVDALAGQSEDPPGAIEEGDARGSQAHRPGGPDQQRRPDDRL
jgi:hypothetical protein